MGNEQFWRMLGSFNLQIETLDHSLGRASVELKSSQSTLRRDLAPLLEDYRRADTPESKS